MKNYFSVINERIAICNGHNEDNDSNTQAFSLCLLMFDEKIGGSTKILLH